MAAVDFPNTPTVNQQFTAAGVTWSWDGVKWMAAPNVGSIAAPSTALPLMDAATAVVGVATKYTREDHVHPSDTSRAPLASPALTGTPTAPTAPANTNTTQLATTAYADVANALRVLKAGDTMTGPLTLSGDPASALQASTKQYVDNHALRGYISGFNLTWVSGTSITVGPGTATDSGNAVSINNNASITKSTAAWAVGAGGAIDTGTFAASKTYFWFVIRRPDTGVVDALFSLSPNAPTLPANYTQFRRIGAVLTDTTPNWVNFMQDGDTFSLASPIAGAGVTNPGTLAFAVQLNSPTGIRVEAKITIGVLANAGAADQAISWYASEVSWPVDLAPNFSSVVSTPAYASTMTGTLVVGDINYIFTNTSAQVRCRLQQSGPGTTVRWTTYGWRDLRGKEGGV